MKFQMDICVIVFLVLLAASMTMQWIRAFKRKKLVHAVDSARLLPIDQNKWASIESSWDFMFKDFRKLQIVKQNTDRLSNEIRFKLAKYKAFSRAEIFVTASMLLFGSVAFLLCSN